MVRAVSIACALAGAAFWVYTSVRAPRAADPGPFFERLDAAIVKAAAEGSGPEGAVLTIVLGGSREAETPLFVVRPPRGLWARLLRKDPEPVFAARLAKAGFTLVYDGADDAFAEPFARMLVAAGRAGVPVRVAAQGDSVIVAVRAADLASETLGKPAVSRLVAAGVPLSAIKAKLPKKRRDSLYAERRVLETWTHLWIDPLMVPPALEVESREKSFERDPGNADWDKIVLSALDGGAEALVPPPPPPPPQPVVRQFRNAEGRSFRKEMKTSLQMLKEAQAAADKNPDGAPAGETHPVRDTGWLMLKSGLDGFQFITGHEAVAFWAQGGLRIDVLAGNRDYAREYCARAGREPKPSEYRTRKVEICANVPTPEDGRPLAHHDYFTILERTGRITVAYMYERPELRGKEMDRFRTAIGALFVPDE